MTGSDISLPSTTNKAAIFRDGAGRHLHNLGPLPYLASAQMLANTRLGFVEHPALVRKEIRPEDIQDQLVRGDDRLLGHLSSHEFDRVQPVVGDDPSTMEQ